MHIMCIRFGLKSSGFSGAARGWGRPLFFQQTLQPMIQFGAPGAALVGREVGRLHQRQSGARPSLGLDEVALPVLVEFGEFDVGVDVPLPRGLPPPGDG